MGTKAEEPPMTQDVATLIACLGWDLDLFRDEAKAASDETLAGLLVQLRLPWPLDPNWPACPNWQQQRAGWGIISVGNIQKDRLAHGN